MHCDLRVAGARHSTDGRGVDRRINVISLRCWCTSSIISWSRAAAAVRAAIALSCSLWTWTNSYDNHRTIPLPHDIDSIPLWTILVCMSSALSWRVYSRHSSSCLIVCLRTVFSLLCSIGLSTYVGFISYSLTSVCETATRCEAWTYYHFFCYTRIDCVPDMKAKGEQNIINNNGREYFDDRK